MNGPKTYKCLRCGTEMIGVPCIEIKTYAEDKTSRLVMAGHFRGNSYGPAESLTLGHSSHMCPDCGMLEIHVCDRDISFLKDYYGKD